MLTIAFPVRFPLPDFAAWLAKLMRAIVTMLELAADFVLKLAAIATVKNDSALTHW